MAVAEGLRYLAGLSFEDPPTFDSLVGDILQLLVECLPVDLTFLATSDGERFQVEAVHDPTGIGMQLGTVLEMCDAYPNGMLTGTWHSASMLPEGGEPPIPSLSFTDTTNTASFAGIRLYHADGRPYGALCILTPQEQSPATSVPSLLALAGRIVMQAVAAREPAQSEERYRQFVERSSAPLAVHQDGTFRYVNSAAVALIGADSADDLIGTSIFAVVHPDDRERVMGLSVKARQDDESIDLLGLKLVRRDGGVLNVELSSVPVPYGSTTMRQVIVRDVTERTRTERLLQGQSDVLEMLATGESLHAVLAALVRLIEEQSSEMLCSVLLLDEDGQHLRHGAAQSLPAAYVEAIDGALIGPTVGSCGRTAYTGQQVIVTDIAEDPLWDGYRDLALAHGLRACWSTPILSSSKCVLGTFAAYYRQPCAPSDEHLRLVGLAAHLARIAIERKRDESALREREGRYRSLVEASIDAIFLLDVHGTVTMANHHAATLHGYEDAAELAGIRAMELVAPEYRDETEEKVMQALVDGVVRNLQYPLLRKDGSTASAELNASVIRDAAGNPAALTAVIRDVSARKQAEEALAHQAMHDALTGLPNRALFHDRLHHALVTAQRNTAVAALLLLDLDRFKDINDTFGHHYGDLLLQQVAERLQTVLRASDTVARLGGDEFALLLPATGQPGALLAARKVLSVLEQSFTLEGQKFTIGASIGIVVYPEHGKDAETLIRRADVAMYAAKSTDTSHMVYALEQDRYSVERLALMTDLRHAIEHNQLTLHYQPQMSLATGQVNSVEALVRWHHPEQGFIPPGDFIALAEHTGVIKPLTLWVLNEALYQCRLWREEGLTVSVAVNLSARNLADTRLADTIEQRLNLWDLDPGVLTIELTESDVMADPDLAMGILSRLHATGIRISIDDFGTGYSSLAYLKRLPVDEIKIDQSFVREMDRSDEDASIVRSVVQLGHSLDLRVVAEGVESQAAVDILAMLGCDIAQGYYLGKPVDPVQLLAGLHPATSTTEV